MLLHPSLGDLTIDIALLYHVKEMVLRYSYLIWASVFQGLGLSLVVLVVSEIAGEISGMVWVVTCCVFSLMDWL